MRFDSRIQTILSAAGHDRLLKVVVWFDRLYLKLKGNPREQGCKNSLKLVGPGRLVSFVRSASGFRVTAPKLFNDSLNNGLSVDDILFTGDKYGFYLNVRTKGEGKYEIGLGCIVAPQLGDGGRWMVQFAEDKVQEIKLLKFWIT